ncbi:hypothetical protein K2173_021614 [Erythroxylum novogranatense]|uniref:RNA-binding protein nob1 n=1 Tax=Erythroxylum novogranatense TaxID=1862640 RepID=A0AAV8TND8_9ROSI|nr:hypothetical protein K2173_021614 [Erythroxylum novogranatense]
MGASSAPQTCWSNVVKTPSPPEKLHTPSTFSPTQAFVASCKSEGGISMAVVDANAVINGGDKLHHLADKFVTVPEVLDEIRDPVSRHRLSFVPFTIDSMEPSPEALNKVIKFARATGDLQTLSDVDLKLVALTYTLEAQIHGITHLRDAPPPIRTVNVKKLPEKDMPGWGSNVPNLEEWEALEREAGDGMNTGSRIVPLKDIRLNVTAVDEQSSDGLMANMVEAHSENHEDAIHGFRRHNRYLPKKTVINIEGKKTVAAGVDASQGQFDDDAGNWRPAVSRSTHRRYLRRKARREHHEALFEKDSQQDFDNSACNNVVKEVSDQGHILLKSSKAAGSVNGTLNESEMIEDNSCSEELSSLLDQMRVEESQVSIEQGEEEDNMDSDRLDFSYSSEMLASSDHNTTIGGKVCEDDGLNSEVNHFEISSHTDKSLDASNVDDGGSEQSWMLRSLSESSVACITSDFAMQNVLLQIGLRLLAPGGMQIRQLHRWILRCHACYTVTAEIGRIFCPECGNGGTLRKLAITVGENGITMEARRPRITLRGTKFSLPLPQGGRNAIAKNPILREDQLPQKFLHPKTKKKTNKQGDDIFYSDDVFSHHTDKRTFQPPVRKALAVFSQKRNPNDNHYSRAKR